MGTELKINLLSSKYKTCFKIIGIFALFVAALIYGEFKYYDGRLDECIDHDGFLTVDPISNDFVCTDSKELKEKGLIIDYKNKKLVNDFEMFYNDIDDISN